MSGWAGQQPLDVGQPLDAAHSPENKQSPDIRRLPPEAGRNADKNEADNHKDQQYNNKNAGQVLPKASTENELITTDVPADVSEHEIVMTMKSV